MARKSRLAKWMNLLVSEELVRNILKNDDVAKHIKLYTRIRSGTYLVTIIDSRNRVVAKSKDFPSQFYRDEHFQKVMRKYGPKGFFPEDEDPEDIDLDDFFGPPDEELLLNEIDEMFGPEESPDELEDFFSAFDEVGDFMDNW